MTNRRAECGALDRLVDAVRAGESRALVVRGDPGVGKTVLLDYLAGRASGSGCRVERAVGVQSEMELAFAGLHQLCAAMLSGAEQLPVPQRETLRTALGVAAGPPPDRFLVGLAVLSLLSEAAGDRPLICLVDDVQWLDRASAQALGFAARRLAVDAVGLVFAAREPAAELAGLPELEVGGLGDDDARALLEAALASPLDPRVRDLIIAETRGNPLALLELPRGLAPAELAGGFGLPGAAPLTGRIEDSFARQLEALPEQTRRLVLLAAADPSGDRALVWRAAGRLGLPRPGGNACGRGRAGHVRGVGAVPASAGPFGGLPIGVDPGEAGDACGAGGGDRPDRRSGPSGLAPGPGRAGPGRGGRGGAGAFGRAGAGARRAGRGRGVPGALGVADRRSGPACRTQPGRGAGLPAGRSVRQCSGPARGGGGRAAR